MPSSCIRPKTSLSIRPNLPQQTRTQSASCLSPFDPSIANNLPSSIRLLQLRLPAQISPESSLRSGEKRIPQRGTKLSNSLFVRMHNCPDRIVSSPVAHPCPQKTFHRSSANPASTKENLFLESRAFPPARQAGNVSGCRLVFVTVEQIGMLRMTQKCHEQLSNRIANLGYAPS